MSVEEGGTTTSSERGAHKVSIFQRLYVGNGALDIVGKRKIAYICFAVLFAVCIGSLTFKGFNFGIEFVGGTQIEMPARGENGVISEDDAKKVYTDAMGSEPDQAQLVGSGGTATVQLRAETLDPGEVDKAKRALFDAFKPIGADGNASRAAISDSAVSGSWGGEISRQAIIALIVFLILVTVFLALYFERWMAVAALAALFHDIIVTAGLYSLSGLEVTPATVIGLLTILGFSLYDTVVVFDKVKENTRGLLHLTRRNYAEAANLALNQTFMRSINTSVIAMLPVLGLMVIGYVLLGSGVLMDLALVQLIGMAAGVVSSLYLATPLLVDLKMREPAYREQADRVRLRRQNRERKGGAATEDEVEFSDDESLQSEMRQERAYAAASAVPARTLRKTDQRKGAAAKPAAKPTGKPTGKPSGKRKR